MIVNKYSETLDIKLQTKQELESLQGGQNLSSYVQCCPNSPKTKIILRCREEAKEDPDQMVFPEFLDARKQFLTEQGFWIEVFPADAKLYEKIIVTIDRRRLAQLASGGKEDSCIVSRCILDRLQIRYSPDLS